MNELPIMPIRAKYADELSEGSPERQALAQLVEKVDNLDSKSAKVYVVDRDEDALTDADIRYIIDNNIQVVYCNFVRYTVNHEMRSNILYLDGIDNSNHFHRNKYKVYPDNEWGFDTSQAIDLNDIKPLYCHPVSFRTNFGSDNKGSRIACLIFNNSSTPFTNSTFADFLTELYNSIGETSRVLASGSYQTENGHIAIASWIGAGVFGYYFTGIDITDGSAGDLSPLTKSQLLERMNNFSDGVNKIN